MRPSQSIKKIDFEDTHTAIAYLGMGNARDKNEEKIKCYNEAIRIYKKCNIENENTALAYLYLGIVCESKVEKNKML